MDGIGKVRRVKEDVLREGANQLLRLYDSSGKVLYGILRRRRERNLDARLVQSLVERVLDGSLVSRGYEIQDEALKASFRDYDRSFQAGSCHYGRYQATRHSGDSQETRIQYKSDSTRTLWERSRLDCVPS